jgi:zinc protease
MNGLTKVPQGPFGLPPMQKTILDNGLTVLVEENHAAKVAAVQIWVRVGSADEAPHEAGLAHVHEHMLFKGTTKRGVGEIAAEIEAQGGDINAWTSFDETVYHVTTASRSLPAAMDVLADAVQHSAFDPEELTKELEVVLEELRRDKDTPSRVASELMFEIAYTQHPYRRPVIGYQDVVERFDRDMILDFYRRWYQPSNMCLVVAGDVRFDDVVAQAKGLFTGARTEPAKRPDRPIEPPQTDHRVAVRFDDIQETYLTLAWPTVSLSHEDVAALDVLSVILGAGESSRLYRRVAREADLVNDCYAYAYSPRDQGLLVVRGQVHGEDVIEAYEALLKETFRLRYELPDPQEIEKAKTIILADAVYQKETVQGLARKLGYFELLAGSSAFEEVYYARVREVTPERVRAVAKQYLNHATLTSTALCPHSVEATVTEPALRRSAEKVEGVINSEYAVARIELGSLGVARTVLENGIELLVAEDRSLPLVSIRAAAIGGLLAETPASNGVSHLLGELLVRGTQRFSAEQITEETDAMAGGISGMSGRNSIGLRGDFLAETWPRGLELFASCLSEPLFVEEEIVRERKTQLEDIHSRHDSLSTVVFDLLAEALYVDHPYHMPSIGKAESVQALTRETIEAAFLEQLHPERVTVTVVGAVDPSDTIRLLSDRLGKTRGHGAGDNRRVSALRLPPAPVGPAEYRSVEVRRDKAQSHVALGFLGVAFDDNRRYALEVAATILGGQAGRLFLELRDRRSLAYSVTALSVEGVQAGYFAVYMGTAPEKLGEAESGLISELEKITQTEVSSQELDRAKQYLVGSHEISLQRTSARCMIMTLNQAYGIGYDDHLRYASGIEAVTRPALLEACREILRFDRMIRAVVHGAPGQSDVSEEKVQHG